MNEYEGKRICGWNDDVLLQLQASARRGISKWNKRHLLVYVAGSLPGIDKDLQVAEMRLALDDIEANCGITFEFTNDKSEADFIEYSKRIDGRGGTLAYHYLPNGDDRPLTGTLDTSEGWDADMSDGLSGISLKGVWEHEGLHGLGLPHAPRGSGALMLPYYSSSILSIQSWDRRELVRRYGPPKEKPDPPDVPPAGPEVPILVEIPEGFVPGLYRAKLSLEDKLR